MSVKSQTNNRLPLILAGALGLVLILTAFWLDNPVGAFLKLRVGTAPAQFAGFLSKIGDWPSLVGIGLLFSLLLFVRGRADLGRMLLVVLLAGTLAGFSATIVRATVGRTRPSSHAPQGFYGPYHDSRWILGRYEFSSFPSGHTATVAGLTAALWMWRRRLALTFAVFAAAVAWSRLALGAHHFSDVIAAVVWGAFVGPWLFIMIEPRFKRWGQSEALEESSPKSDDSLVKLETPQA